MFAHVVASMVFMIGVGHPILLFVGRAAVPTVAPCLLPNLPCVIVLQAEVVEVRPVVAVVGSSLKSESGQRSMRRKGRAGANAEVQLTAFL